MSELFMTGGEKVESDSFFSYMASISDGDKCELLNIGQYVLISIIPLLLVIKLMKMFLPEYDPTKGNIEILIEVVIQLFAIFILFWFIHRFILFIPTYSKLSYSSMNLFNVIIPFIFLLFTLETNISKKSNILLNRLLLYLGLQKEMYTEENDSEESNHFVPPALHLSKPSAMDVPHPQNTKQEVNYNQVFENATNKVLGDNVDTPYVERELSAANEILSTNF